MLLLVQLTESEQKELDEKIKNIGDIDHRNYGTVTGCILRYHEDKFIERMLNNADRQGQV